jgi:hypothetical protein
MKKRLDLTNVRFGFWIVLGPAGKNGQGKTQWLCQCDCGTKRAITTNSLRTGNSTSCGCNHCPDLINQKFGNVTVLSLSESKKNNRRNWLCKCECGKSITLTTYQLRNSNIKKCDCLIQTNTNASINDVMSTQGIYNNMSILKFKVETIKNNCEILINETQQIMELLYA